MHPIVYFYLAGSAVILLMLVWLLFASIRNSTLHKYTSVEMAAFLVIYTFFWPAALLVLITSVMNRNPQEAKRLSIMGSVIEMRNQRRRNEPSPSPYR